MTTLKEALKEATERAHARRGAYMTPLSTKEIINTAFASLEASGFVLVPKEATDEMAKNACELDCTLDECQARGRCYGYPAKLARAREHYDYMLAARPKIGDDG